MSLWRRIPVIIAAIGSGVLICACAPDHSASVPGDAADDQPFSAIAADEVIRFTGTEPFWGGDITGTALTWTTPENIDGQRVAVARFAGRGGISFSGELDGQAFDLAVTPGECSDGMSDRTYPFTVTVTHGDQQLDGCGWSDRQGYTGGE